MTLLPPSESLELEAVSSLAALASGPGPGRGPFRVLSLAGSSLAGLAALVMKQLGRPVFVISAEEKEAARIADEIGFFLRALAAPGTAWALPAREVYFALPRDGRWSRTAALAAMVAAGPGAPVAVSASLAAALQRTMSPETFCDHLVELTPDARLDRDRFLATLVRSGYTAVSAVMEPGDFSVRGGIIDFFAPGAEGPVRLELWEEEVKSLRRFEPGSQKSGERLARALAPPLKEVILDRAAGERAGRWLREFLGRVKEGAVRVPVAVNIKAAAELLARIERSEHFPGIESFLPAFYPGRVSALDYLDSNWTVIYHEPFLCEQALARGLEQLEEEWRRELEAGLALPPGEHFQPRSRAEELISGCAVLVVGAVVPGPGPEDRRAGEDEDPVGGPRLDLAGEAAPGISADLSFLRVRSEAEEPLGPFLEAVREFMALGVRTVLVSPLPAKAQNLRELLEGHGIALPVREDPEGALTGPEAALITTGALERGFVDLAGRLAVIPEAEVFGEKIRPARRRRPLAESFHSDLSDLKEGDPVVHVDHGVGLYRGLKSLEVQWVGEWDFVRERQRPRLRMDCIQIEYAEGSNLYVPVHRINQVSKYAGAGETPALDALGGTSWERLKTRVKRSMRDFAQYLVRIHAERRLREGVAFPEPDASFREFEEGFEYEETPDQLGAIEDVLADMARERPMDRIVCGDVGYGKTEVALRAAFLAAMSGKQVAVLAPTTILVQQHYETFRKRLKNYPLEVRTLSRFVSAKGQKEVVAGLARGAVDVVIGTHRLLSRDVKFADLGLLVIDEEHRFGVRHKERLRELRATVDTLTLSATPIPRTLYMALSGLRDLSLINTPPPDRLSIHTELIRSDDRLIKEAIERELRRGGQVFYVHNRVQTIAAAAERVRRLVPAARTGVAHGQMHERELERMMQDFVARGYDLLVCSAIIESGLDIPSVNTMIVDRADQFGLAQLYQLRGRIGRSKDRAYCYLAVPAKGALTREAAERLRLLHEFAELGSGFRIAAHDLELRGAGNLLGAEQSGHLSRIGLELYMQLLEEEVGRLKGEAPEPRLEPEIKLPVASYLSETYMPDQRERLTWYKRISRAGSDSELVELAAELTDRYGPLPGEAANLIEVGKIKVRLKKIRAREIAYTGAELSLALDDEPRVDLDRLLALATREPAKWRLTPDNRIGKAFKAREPGELFPGIREFLNEVAGCDSMTE